MPDFPPDDLSVEVLAWYDEVFPSTTGHAFRRRTADDRDQIADERADVAVWYGRWILLWQSSLHADSDARRRMENLKHRLYEWITTGQPPVLDPPVPGPTPSPGPIPPGPTPGPSPQPLTSADVERLVFEMRPGPAAGRIEDFQRRVLDWVAARDPRWGRHRRPNGALPADILAFDVPALGKPYQIFDFVVGSSGDTPSPGWLDQTLTMEPGSTFSPWTSAPSPSGRLRVSDRWLVYPDGRPFLWAGCTSFDLPVRVGRDGDLSWVRWLAAERYTIARIVPASLFRTRRSLEEGRRWLPPTLDALQAVGLYAEVVTLVDTGWEYYNLSRDEMRAYVRDIAAICARYPMTVDELGSELSHPSQSRALEDVDFLFELMEIAKREAPDLLVSVGSTHGGEEFRLTQGDYITVHSDRRIQDPDANVFTLVGLQNRMGKPVIDDEPERSDDWPGGAEYARIQGDSARRRGLAGSTLHLQAGLEAKVSQLGAQQEEGTRLFVQAMRGE